MLEPAVTGSLAAAAQHDHAKFLSTKVMPVDAYKIRNSLYLTVRLDIC